MNIKEIFYELIKEAKDGKVIIDEDPFPIGFNTIINDNEQYLSNNNLSTLEINNLDLFLNKLKEYLELVQKKDRQVYGFLKRNPHDYYKFLIAYLFTNATTEDFLKPIEFIDKEIAFLKENTFNYLNEGIKFQLGSNFKNSSIEIKNEDQSVMMETPYKMTFTFTKLIDNKKVSYKLPSISYGIKNNECYIYSILNSENKDADNEDEKYYKKKISRQLYKVNKDVHDESEESINDVSPSAVISLLIFISLLKKENITNIKAVPYLPLRYLSRDLAAQELNEEQRKILQERNDTIQNNLTNKFIRTFKRVAYHMSGIEINSYPYEYDEYLNIKLGNEQTKVNNELLDELSKTIK